MDLIKLFQIPDSRRATERNGISGDMIEDTIEND
jgi:hypothetical protein